MKFVTKILLLGLVCGGLAYIGRHEADRAVVSAMQNACYYNNLDAPHSVQCKMLIQSVQKRGYEVIYDPQTKQYNAESK